MEAWTAMKDDLERNTIHVGDSKEKLENLPDNSVDCCMTSPPYWGLRDYGEEDQLGLEEDPEDYVRRLVDIFSELKRVLKPSGTFFLNIDDTYSRGSRNKYNSEDTLRKQSGSEAGEPDYGINYDLPDKCMSMIPERVMMALVNDGWILRNKNIWSKPNPMPESVKDRFSTTWEYVYMFSLEQDYYFDLDAIRQPYSDATKKRGASIRQVDNKGDTTYAGDNKDSTQERSLNNNGKNPGDTWEITTKSFSDAHFAVYPEELVEKPLKAGCPKKVCAKCGKAYERDVEENVLDERSPEDGQWANNGSDFHAEDRNGSENSGLRDGYKAKSYESKGFQQSCNCNTNETEKGVILDPFAGAGTTCLVARRFNRDYIGIELNEEYAEIARDRIKEEIGGQPLDQFIEKSEVNTSG